MKYFLQRDGRNFGPYSLDDLKRYQSEGRIGPDDTIRSEDSDKWIPQTEFFNPPAASPAPVLPPAAPGFGGPPAGGSGVPRAGAFGAVPNPAASGAWPAPPDMQWYLVLI
ncbi:MAG: DUF4339 domain-containing protein, partial [Acidobacteriota bacterium]